ncbi:MAG: DUF1329 domain-containing protein [Burkholderiales bacterium]
MNRLWQSGVAAAVMNRRRFASLGVWAACPVRSWAKASDADLTRLEGDLTPVGAQRAGNRQGTLPAWTGGLASPPPGYQPARGLLDPFADERALYTVDGGNVGSHLDKLAAGEIEMLRRYPTYRLEVYPSHRTAALPAREYAHVAAEARGTALAEGGNGVIGLRHSTVPFPLPRSGIEVIWNHLCRWRGGSLQRSSDAFAVMSNGAFTPARVEEYVAWAAAMKQPEPNRLVYFLGLLTSPPTLAGLAVLAIDPIDQTRESRQAWTYNPGQRRVLRAPSLGYDAPANGADGLRTIDDFDGFNGAPDRYDWQLVGKREMLISYNNFRLTSKKLRHADLVRPLHMNPEHLRYELHRVWVVDARLKPGASHIYARRVFYIDEDTWQIAHVDKYDSRGELWRVQEGHAVQFYDVPAPWYAAEVGYDLNSRRYLVNGLTNEAPPMQFGVPLEAGFFSADSLRRLAR